MVREPTDLTGKTFGYLTVRGLHGSSPKGRLWVVRCICGVERFATTAKLQTGKYRSCGCQQKKNSKLW